MLLAKGELKDEQRTRIPLGYINQVLRVSEQKGYPDHPDNMNTLISEMRIYRKQEANSVGTAVNEHFCYWRTAVGDKGLCTIENKEYGLRITNANGSSSTLRS